MTPPRRVPTRLVTFVLACACAAAGCQRRPHLVPAGADSTQAVADSFTVSARAATDRWESGMNEEAAPFTARALREVLQVRPNAPWADRMRGVLDSLGIAAEVAGDERAAAANLFSRAEPEGDSWPWLFWREKDGVHFQAVEGHGMHLEQLVTRGFGAASQPSDTARAAGLFAKRVGGGRQPVLVTWKYAHGRWDLAQTLGPDSLGGTGSGEFVLVDSSLALTVRTYRPTPFFDECATCPHVFHEREYRWTLAGFKLADDQTVPSPYTTFTSFIAALVADDRDRASGLVTDHSLVDFARRFAWQDAGRGRWRIAPSSDEGGMELVFLRGATDAYRVRFEPRDGDWVIAGFEPTTRALE